MANIWDSLDVTGRTVLDVGVGNSTRALIGKGVRRVIALDVDRGKVKSLKSELAGYDNVDLVCSDASSIPLRGKAVDVAVLYFVLHEVNPKVHGKVVSGVKRVARRVIVVEPAPAGCEAYNLFARLWREAMHSVGSYEDYKPAEYWVRLLVNAGISVVRCESIVQDNMLGLEELKAIINETADEWARKGVKKDLINELKRVLDLARERGFKWSDLVVVVGVAD